MSVTIFGGTTQFVVTWLIDRTNDAMVPAWYQIVANVAGIIGVVLLMPHAEVVRGRAGQPNPSFASTGHGVTETRS